MELKSREVPPIAGTRSIASTDVLAGSRRMTPKQHILILGSGSDSTNILYHTLAREFGVVDVVIESRSLGSKLKFWRNRVRNLGLIHVLGQVLFLMTWAPALRIASRRRIRAIKESYELDSSPIDGSRTARVTNINADESIRLIQSYRPQLVVLSGTSILSSRLIESIPAPIINIHAGITPAYRGVHGAYWALAEQDAEHCGVTIHFVDAGIDTGQVIAQATITPTPDDTYATYPLLQLGEGMRLINGVVKQVLDGTVELRAAPALGSRCWSHPTVWEYTAHRVSKNIR